MSHVCDGRDLSCLGCADVAARLETVRAAMTIDDQLDDIKRARIWAELEDKLGDAAPRRRRWPVAIGFAAVAAAAAVTLIARLPRSAAPTRLLSAAADTTVSSRIGPHTLAALVGPAELELIGPAGDATSVRLRSGTLLAEFAGGPDRTLRVEAPGARVEVVGTLFAVEVRNADTCASVARGHVRVTSAAGVVDVARGERYCTGDVLRPIASDMREALERHQAVIAMHATPSDRSPGDDPPDPSVVAEPPARDPGVVDRRPVWRDPRPASAPSIDRAAGGSPRALPAAAAPGRRLPAAGASTPASSPDTAPARRPAVAATSAPRPSEPAPRTAPTVLTAPRAPTDDEMVRAAPTRRPAVAATSAPRASEPAPRTVPTVPTVPTDDELYRSAPTRRPGVAASSAPRPSEPAPRTAPTVPTVPTDDELYRAAETALAARNPAAADRALATLIAAHPGSPLVDQALYDRARIAYQQHAWATARRHLDQLAAIPSTPLAEPGHYLTCRIAVEARDGEAATCLADYRKAFPRSPHDLEALALLVQLAHARAGCAAAAALVAELVRIYPRTTLAAGWRTRCPEPR